MVGIRLIFELHDGFNSEISICTDLIKRMSLSSYLKINISLFKTLILLSAPHLIIITIQQYRMIIGFWNIFFLQYHLTFFFARWRLSAGRTGPAKTMVNNSGLSQIKTNIKSATINWWILNVKNISKSLENINIKSTYDHKQRFIQRVHSSSVKFMNCNRARSE